MSGLQCPDCNTALVLNMTRPPCSAHAYGYSHANESFEVEIMRLRLLLVLSLSLFLLPSCSYLRSSMINTMDVIVAPYHYVFDEEEDEYD